MSQFLWWEVNLKGLRGNLKQKNPALAKQNHFYNLFILPGNQLRVQVLPRFDRTTQYFDELDLDQRKCKLPHETEGFVFLKEYSRHSICIRAVHNGWNDLYKRQFFGIGSALPILEIEKFVKIFSCQIDWCCKLLTTIWQKFFLLK